MYINKVIIYGNITRDPELKTLPSGMPVCELGVATNRIYKDKNGMKQESADFHNVVVFGKQAELVKQYLGKGSGIFLEGRIQTRSWDAPDGQKRYRTEIIADRIQFGPKSGGGGGGNYTSNSAPVDSSSKDAGKSEPAIEYPDEEINVDEIPF